MSRRRAITHSRTEAACYACLSGSMVLVGAAWAVYLLCGVW